MEAMGCIRSETIFGGVGKDSYVPNACEEVKRLDDLERA